MVNAVERGLVRRGRPRDQNGAERWRLGDAALAAAGPPATAGDPPELERVALRAEVRLTLEEAGLSRKEAAVWTLGALGHTRRQIAAALGSAPGTVASQKARATRKLRSYTRPKELLGAPPGTPHRQRVRPGAPDARHAPDAHDAHDAHEIRDDAGPVIKTSPAAA